MALVNCLEVAEVRAGFERSNLPEDAWAHWAKLVDDMCGEQGVGPEHLGAFTEFSKVEVYRFPNGEPGVTDTHLLAVLDVGLVMMREAGFLRKRTDSQFMMFSEFQGGEFHPEESIGGRGWGHVCIQAARGSVPLFRFGWYFDSRSSDQRSQLNAAANERDRILQAIRRWV
jgi:hypothetical protein